MALNYTCCFCFPLRKGILAMSGILAFAFFIHFVAGLRAFNRGAHEIGLLTIFFGVAGILLAIAVFIGANEVLNVCKQIKIISFKNCGFSELFPSTVAQQRKVYLVQRCKIATIFIAICCLFGCAVCLMTIPKNPVEDYSSDSYQSWRKKNDPDSYVLCGFFFGILCGYCGFLALQLSSYQKKLEGIPTPAVDYQPNLTQAAGYHQPGAAFNQPAGLFHQPQSPIHQSQLPVHQSHPPVYQSQPLTYQPQQPVHQSQPPVYQPQPPAYQPQQSAYQSQPPVYQPQSSADMPQQPFLSHKH